MPDLRYIHAKEKFLQYAYDVFQAYFPDEREFIRQFDALETDEIKNHFLHITSFYKLLVRDGKFFNTDVNLPQYTDYIDETFRYVALISLIEALYTTEQYKDFYEWLRPKARDGTFPINDPESLDALFQQYTSEHGLTQKAVRFFMSLPEEEKQRVVAGLTVNRERRPIEDLAKLLYRLRSEFVHSAKMILEVGNDTMISRRAGKLVVSALGLDELQHIFEVGALTYFQFHPPAQ
jgi:hypothetical protein